MSMTAASTLVAYESKNFLWRVEKRVGYLTLNRPERKNPLTFESYTELRDLFRALSEAEDIRCVIVNGSGGNFCSGGDVHDIIGPLTQMPIPNLLQFTRLTGDVVKAMRSCPQLIIAFVEGACAGAGAIIAMAADLRYATSDAKTAFLFARVGLAGCDMGACAVLPRLIGQGRAAELLFTGRSFTADEGADWGFFNAVVTAADFENSIVKLAENLAGGPFFAHAMTKRMLQQEWNLSIDQALEAEAQAQAICMKTNDFVRAYEAFIVRKQPSFEGD